MTLASLRNRVIVDKLDDEEYDTEVVDNFINDTINDIFSEYELPFMEKIYSGVVPTGVTMFSMPTDVSVIQSQIITGPDGSQTNIEKYFIPFREFNKRYQTPGDNAAGPITWWTSYNGKMILARPTDQDYTMDIFYIKSPTPLLGENDVPDIPDQFEELIVLGAYKRVLSREGDNDIAAIVENEYNRRALQMVNRYGYRFSNGPIRMKNRQVGR